MLIEVSRLQDDILLVEYHGVYQPSSIYNAIKPYHEAMPARIVIVDLRQLMLDRIGLDHIKTFESTHPMALLVGSLEEYSFILTKHHPVRDIVIETYTRVGLIDKIKFYDSLDHVPYRK